MRPKEARVARLDGYELRFDLPVGKGERGVANVRMCGDAHVWGVAYQLSDLDFDFLDRTEGVHRGSYRRTPVMLRAGDETVPGFTYTSARGRDGRRPSRRYLGLLIVGARHHGLPASYITSLRELSTAPNETDRQLELFS